MTLEENPLAEMDLDALRAYRKDLQSEEDKVSYWRRLIHARIDLIEAGSSTDGSLTLPQLIRVLGDTGTGASRTALSSIHASEPLPDLPESEWMWVSEIDYHDAGAVAEAIGRLRAAEEKLTNYRKALFERLDAATAELIVRYRDNPQAALSILPLAD
ncbi:MAG: RsiG family protein [Sporichthyaceae bacterium]